MVRFVLNGQRSVGKVLVYNNLDKKSLDSALDELPTAWTGPHRWCTVFAADKMRAVKKCNRHLLLHTNLTKYLAFQTFIFHCLWRPIYMINISSIEYFI